jgi:hypothetical protein
MVCLARYFRVPHAGALALCIGLVACGDELAPRGAEPVVDPMPTAGASSPRVPEPAAGNTPPRILSIRFEPEQPTVADRVRALVEIADPDGDAVWLRYTWDVGGRRLDSDRPQVALQGTSRGDRIEVTVIASDGKHESPPVKASTQTRNARPLLERVQIEPGAAIVAGKPIVARPSASDPDGDSLRFLYRWTVNGRQAHEDRAVLATDTLRRGDTVQLEVVATDGIEDSEPLNSPRLRVLNAPPRIVSLPAEPSNDETVRYQVRAEDPDGDDLQFHLEQAPEGMRIDALTGAIRWAPRSDQVGVQTVSVVVDDLQGGIVLRTFDLTVSAAGDAPPAAPER